MNIIWLALFLVSSVAQARLDGRSTVQLTPAFDAQGWRTDSLPNYWPAQRLEVAEAQDVLYADHAPQFKPGDCVKLISAENWENDSLVKILEVGKRKYRTDKRYWSNVEFYFDADRYYTKTKCPKEKK